MLDIVTFIISFLIVTSLLAGLTALVMSTIVFSSRQQAKEVQRHTIKTVADSTNSVFEIALAGPLALASYCVNNIASTLLLASCVALSLTMFGKEAEVLPSVSDLYEDVNNLWMNGFIEPAVAFLSVLYASVVPIFNTITIVASEFVYGAIRVLSDQNVDPFIIFKALLVPPRATGKLAQAVGDFFNNSAGKSWLVNSLDTSPAVQLVQEEIFVKIGDFSDILCSSLAPAIFVGVDVLKTKELREVVFSAVNVPIRAVQVIAKLVAPRFGKLDVDIFVEELQTLVLNAGAVADDILQAVVRLGYFPVQLATQSSDDITIRKPSLGGSFSRLVVGGIAALHVPVKMAITALEGEPLYDATSVEKPVKNLHLGITQLVAAAHNFLHLVYEGSLGSKTELQCKYYAYNFFESEQLEDSFEKACMCQSKAHCGFHGKCEDGKCKCDDGYVNTIPAQDEKEGSSFRCVKSCTEKQKEIRRMGYGNSKLDLELGKVCGFTFQQYDSTSNIGATILHGNCIEKTGRCSCKNGAVYDLKTGICTTPDQITADRYVLVNEQTPTATWADHKCDGVKIADLEPAAECAVQSVLLSGLGFAYTAWNFFRELVFRFPESVEEDLDLLLQQFDGVWYPRFESVSCEFRKSYEVGDQLLQKEKCKCSADTNNLLQNLELTDFDPYCGLPTLNANVYSHLDAFAFYAGHKLPFQNTRRLHYIFVGGTGTQWGFLSDTLGAYTTTMARKAVEKVRVTTHLIAGLPTYLKDITGLLSNLKTNDNVLRLPTNCNWGKDEPTATCKQRQYDEAKSNVCQTTNNNNDCVCNHELPYDQSDKCRCIALFPFVKYKSENWDKAYRSDYFAKFYHHKAPWCNTMLSEYSHFWEMSSSIAIQNVFARFANVNGNPLSKEIDSQCFDESRTYTISDTSALTRVFQPNAKGSQYVFTGTLGTSSAQNRTICEKASKFEQVRFKTNKGNLFLSSAACSTEAEELKHRTTRPPYSVIRRSDNKLETCVEGPYELRKLALQNYVLDAAHQPEGTELLCYQLGSNFEGIISTATDHQKNQFKTNHTKWCQSKTSQQDWVILDPYRNEIQSKAQEKYKESTGTDDLTVTASPTNVLHELHPQTCGYYVQNDHLQFQPCRYSCKTSGGFDTCWCNVTVHHDLRCNLGNMYRQARWAGVEKDRQKTTAIISLFALLPEGVQSDQARLLCDRYRTEGSQAAIIASLLTLNQGGLTASKIRESIAKIIFAFWESSIVAGLSLDQAARLINHNIQSKRQSMATRLVPDTVADITQPGNTLFDNLNALGSPSFQTMAFQSIISDALHNVLKDNSKTKICKSGKLMCNQCSGSSDCQDQLKKRCELLRVQGLQRTDPDCLKDSVKADTFCFPEGECPADLLLQESERTNGFCCNTECEETRTCPPEQKCKDDKETKPVTCSNSQIPGSRQLIANEHYCHKCNADPKRRFSYISAKPCYGWPKYRDTEKCYEPNSLCVDKKADDFRKCAVPECALKTDNDKPCERKLPDFVSIIITVLIKEWIFISVNVCTVLEALKHILITVMGDDRKGEEIITDVQDFINLLFRVLDEAFAELAILAAQTTLSFIGALSHITDAELWKKFVVNAFKFIATFMQIGISKGWDLIKVMIAFLPSPMDNILTQILGGICIATHHTMKFIQDSLEFLGFSDPFNYDWSDPDPADACYDSAHSEYEEELFVKDLSRRRLKEVWSNTSHYEFLQKKVDWTGDTTCSRIGRLPSPPETPIELEIWKSCLINRQRMSVLRLTLNTTYLPWTLLDDWTQPLRFGVAFTHGAFIYLTEGEAPLHTYEQLGYPVNLSKDVMDYFLTWRPSQPMLHTAMQVTESYWPDTHHNTHGIGHNLYHLLDKLSTAKVPKARTTATSWKHLRESTGTIFKHITQTVRLPHIQMRKEDYFSFNYPRETNHQRRRLQENVAAVPDNYCEPNSTSKACINCALLQNVVDNTVEAVEKAAAFYSSEYLQIIDIFVKKVQHWEAKNQDEETSIFPGVDLPFTALPALPVQPTPTNKLSSPTSITHVDWRYIAEQFLKITNDTYIPVVQHSLWWYLKYPLKQCEPFRMAYDACENPKYSLADAAALTVRTMAIFWTIGFVTGLNIPILLQIPLASMLFLIFRYDYVPRCIPVAPTCLIKDLQWTLEALTPPCLCQLVPELVVNQQHCQPGLCLHTNDIAYRSCPDRTLGIFWTPIFTLRWFAPDIFDFVTSEFEAVDEIQQMRDDLENGIPLDPLDLACAKLSMYNIVTVILLIKAGFVVVAAVLLPIIRLLISTVSTVGVNVPFIFNQVPEFMKADMKGPGILLQGWNK